MGETYRFVWEIYLLLVERVLITFFSLGGICNTLVLKFFSAFGFEHTIFLKVATKSLFFMGLNHHVIYTCSHFAIIGCSLHFYIFEI